MCLKVETIRKDRKKAEEVRTVYRIVVRRENGDMVPYTGSGFTYHPQTWHDLPVSERGKTHWWNRNHGGSEFHKGLICSFLNRDDALKQFKRWGGSFAHNRLELWEAIAEDIVWFGKQNDDQIDECVLHGRVFHERKLDPEAWWI
jgi:hypothetical protein